MGCVRGGGVGGWEGAFVFPLPLLGLLASDSLPRVCECEYMCLHVDEVLVYVSECFYLSVCMCLCAVAYWGSSFIMAPMTSFQRSTCHPFLSLPPAAIAN